ncbi:MAG: Lipoprotein releasing system transmembrane protein LolC/LolE [Fluviibacter phosphoraccumulans EoVTN8]
MPKARLIVKISFQLLIGLRYVRSRRQIGQDNRFISFISSLSMVGIALGVAALIVVLSVMNGFQKELRSRILGVTSHIEVMGMEGALMDWQRVAAQARQVPQVLAAAPYVQGQVMLNGLNREAGEGPVMPGSGVRGAIVRGIDPQLEDTVADFSSHMKHGSLDVLQPGSFKIVLGSDLARALGVVVGDRVTVIAPEGVVTPAGVIPRIKSFEVGGVFDFGMFEYDSGLALIDLKDAQVLFRLGQSVTGVRLKVDDPFKAPQIARSIAPVLDEPAYLIDWSRKHANFFRAVQIEKRMMFLILFLIVAVAAFNIVSTLVMAVTDKRGDIAILRTLGASRGSIAMIFMVQGALIGLIGLGLGVAGGVALALNIDTVVPAIERLFGIHFLSREVYFISDLPSDLQWNDVITISTTAFVLTLLVTLYPSLRAARVQPAEALRHE